MEMPEVIRRRRAELDMSQADLAKAAGVDVRQIRRYESGQQQPTLSVAVATFLDRPSTAGSLDLIQIEATRRGRPVEEGGYLWRGELRLWDNEILMGWYAANDGSVRSKGTMYFQIHPHGINMTGRWVGLSYDGQIVSGWGSMARTEDEARELIYKLKESGSGVVA